MKIILVRYAIISLVSFQSMKSWLGTSTVHILVLTCSLLDTHVCHNNDAHQIPVTMRNLVAIFSCFPSFQHLFGYICDSLQRSCTPATFTVHNMQLSTWYLHTTQHERRQNGIVSVVLKFSQTEEAYFLVHAGWRALRTLHICPIMPGNTASFHVATGQKPSEVNRTLHNTRGLDLDLHIRIFTAAQIILP